MKSRILYFISLLILSTFCACGNKNETVITVSNPTNFDRNVETVEIDWKQLADKGYKADSIIVLDANGKEIPSQVVYNTNGNAQTFLFQVKLNANTSENFFIKEAKPNAWPTQVQGKQAHKRYNDFIWENNIIAFRIYHTDLIPIDGPSGGLDVWSKRTKDMIIDTWLGHMDYHRDHGQGCDFYKVGPTLGAGGISLLEDGQMKMHANYTNVKILADGPIRLIADFSFNEQEIQGKKVTLTQKLTLDAGSSINRFDVTFNSELKDLPLVTGIVKRKGEGEIYQDSTDGCIMYWEPEHKPHGHQGLGILMTNPAKMGALQNHIVAYGNAKPNVPFTYYCGACWDMAGYFKTSKEWKAYLKTYNQQLLHPLEVKVITE